MTYICAMCPPNGLDMLSPVCALINCAKIKEDSQLNITGLPEKDIFCFVQLNMCGKNLSQIN